MKNDEKVEINLSQGVEESELSAEEYYQLNYDTALRYINIAEHMKKFEDQSKYYHRSIQYLKKINDDGRFTDWTNDLRRLTFEARAKGIIELYEEAEHIRDSAKTPQDFYAAQSIFHRIDLYVNGVDGKNPHPLYEKWTTPEVYAKANSCLDAGKQAKECEKLAQKLESTQKRHSLIASIGVIVVILAILAFSTTTAARLVLATAFEVVGDYSDAYRKYNAVYERSGDEHAYEKYLETRYKSGLEELDSEEYDSAYSDLYAVAKENYEDSQEKLTAFETENVKNTEIGETVKFANMYWRVLAKDGNQVFMIKDKALGSTPFNDKAGACSWSNSSVRTWLNGTFLNENFFDSEIKLINNTDVQPSKNTDYPGLDPGEATTDKLFLLSAEDVSNYNEQLHETETCWWLRTPGAVEGSMSFVYPDKKVMSYGYDVTNTEITVKPVMWLTVE